MSKSTADILIRLHSATTSRASPELLNAAMQEIIALRAALHVAKAVCGRNHMNCPGSAQVRAALESVR